MGWRQKEEDNHESTQLLHNVRQANKHWSKSKGKSTSQQTTGQDLVVDFAGHAQQVGLFRTTILSETAKTWGQLVLTHERTSGGVLLGGDVK